MKTLKFIIYVILCVALIVIVASLFPSCAPSKMIGGQPVPNCKPHKGYKVKPVRNDRKVFLPTSKL